MKTNISDSLVEEVTDRRFRVYLKNSLVKLLIWLKNSNRFTRGIVLMTGQVKDELYDPKTGITIKTVYPLHLASFNSIGTPLKRKIAKWIGASNATEWIGANSLATQASFENKDGIAEQGTGYSYTTTKDSGGTGAEDNIVFKGVRTAAGSESHTSLDIGMTIKADFSLTTTYATQTISKNLTNGQVYTVFWTFTVT
ncbi:MAG: hypothetical protein ACUZ8H_00140 [Candidatus Anammoxibacter sp.]